MTSFPVSYKITVMLSISIPWFAYDNQLIGNVFHAVGNKEFEQFSVRYKINLQEIRTRIRKGKIKYALKK